MISSVLEDLQIVVEPWSEVPCCPCHAMLPGDAGMVQVKRLAPLQLPHRQPAAGLFLFVN